MGIYGVCKRTMENQMEKKMDNEMEAEIVQGLMGMRSNIIVLDSSCFYHFGYRK